MSRPMTISTGWREPSNRLEPIVIGPCKCGGYGQCLDEESEKRQGRCHIPADEVLSAAGINLGGR